MLENQKVTKNSRKLEPLITVQETQLHKELLSHANNAGAPIVLNHMQITRQTSYVRS
jgi:hypothetical protein